MTLNLDTLNLTILPYNDINRNKQNNKNNSNFSEYFENETRTENNNNLNQIDENQKINLKTWGNIFKVMQNISSSQTMNNYKAFMAMSSYGNLKTL